MRAQLRVLQALDVLHAAEAGALQDARQRLGQRAAAGAGSARAASAATSERALRSAASHSRDQVLVYYGKNGK